MEVKKYENNLEYITELHPIEKRECWTLSDYITFLQEVEKLGYGQYYLANSDYETGDTWLYNRRGDVGFLALHVKEDKDVLRRTRSLCYGASRIPYAYTGKCLKKHVGAWMELYKEGRNRYPYFSDRYLVLKRLRLG